VRVEYHLQHQHQWHHTKYSWL